MKPILFKGENMGRLLIVLMLALSACHSGWDKDPLSGEEERIRNAELKKAKPPKIPPPDQGALSIDMPAVYSVKEGETLEIPIRYNIIHPEVVLTSIEVQGLEQNFPGSNFDKENQKIILRPDYDFVPTDLDYIVAPLTVSFFNKYEDQVEEVKRTIAIHVIPENSTIPEIVSVVLEKDNKITLGEAKKVKVTVKDASPEYAPRLRVFDAYSSSVIGSQYFDLNSEGVYDAGSGHWVFEFDFKFPKDFYTKGSGVFGRLELYAYSITGIPSRGLEVTYRIYGDAREPLIMAENTIYFREGEATDYTFSVFDPLNRGDVKAKCSDLPKGMKCTCRGGKLNSTQIYFCTLEWVPHVSGTFKMKLIGENKVDTGNIIPVTAKATKEVSIVVRSAQ